MLRSFRVANHRSIRNEQELLLIPAYAKHEAAVPVTAIFGANASGKSNVLDALGFMRQAVRSSHGSWEPGTGVSRHPFLLDPSAAGEPSLYVVDLQLSGVRFTYGFLIDDDRVREEWLYTYPQARRRVIFERDENGVRLGSTLPDHRSRETTLTRLTRENALFLSTAAHTNQAEVMPVYDWFRDGISLLQGTALRIEPARLARRLDHAQTDRQIILELIRTADLGISDIQVQRSEDEESGLLSQLVKPKARRSGINFFLAHGKSTILFLQGKGGVPLTAADQSAGTLTWIALLDLALAALERGSALVVDELDTSLHPRLTARLVELFQDSRTNPRGAQLIFVTHDVAILGTSLGKPILARDQIWFVQKDDEGSTTLFPLTDFHPRKEENTERRYLGGSYGAVPAVFSDSLVDAYLAVRSEHPDDPA